MHIPEGFDIHCTDGADGAFYGNREISLVVLSGVHYSYYR
jgi:hypothetical protein